MNPTPEVKPPWAEVVLGLTWGKVLRLKTPAEKYDYFAATQDRRRMVLGIIEGSGLRGTEIRFFTLVLKAPP